MPVIGRMDEQVDEVLIKPLTRKDAPPDQTPHDATPPENATNDIHGNARLSNEASPQEKTITGKDPLPVWLL